MMNLPGEDDDSSLADQVWDTLQQVLESACDHPDGSKTTCALAVWCLGVQKFPAYMVAENVQFVLPALRRVLATDFKSARIETEVLLTYQA